MLVDEKVSPPRSSNGVSSGVTLVRDLLIRDLMSGDLADFQLLTDDFVYEDHALGKNGFGLHPRIWRSSSRLTSGFLYQGGA